MKLLLSLLMLVAFAFMMNAQSLESDLPDFSKMNERKTSVFNENDLRAVVLQNGENDDAYLALKDAKGKILKTTLISSSSAAPQNISWLNETFVALTTSTSSHSDYSIYTLSSGLEDEIIFMYVCGAWFPFPSRFKVQVDKLVINNDFFEITVNVDKTFVH